THSSDIRQQVNRPRVGFERDVRAVAQSANIKPPGEGSRLAIGQSRDAQARLEWGEGLDNLGAILIGSCICEIDVIGDVRNTVENRRQTPDEHNLRFLVSKRAEDTLGAGRSFTHAELSVRATTGRMVPSVVDWPPELPDFWSFSIPSSS